MDLVHRNRSGEPVALCAVVHPIRVFPSMMVEARDDGARFGPQLGIKTVGITLEYGQIRGHWANIVFVNGPFGECRPEKCPYSRRAAIAHRMGAAIPLIEVSDHAYAHGVRRP